MLKRMWGTLPVELERLEAGKVRLRLDGEPLEADVRILAEGRYSILCGGQSYEIAVHDRDLETFEVHMYEGVHRVVLRDPVLDVLRGRAGGAAGGDGVLRAPMPARVVRVMVAEGDRVEEGQGLLVLEAMKMQNEFQSPAPGVVRSLRVQEGDAVDGGDILAEIAADTKEGSGP